MVVHQNKGTCSRSVSFEIDDNGVITACQFQGGCPGNTVGVASLAVGRKAADVAATLRGIVCPRGSGSSCPAQLAEGLEEEIARRATVSNS